MRGLRSAGRPAGVKTHLQVGGVGILLLAAFGPIALADLKEMNGWAMTQIKARAACPGYRGKRL